MFAYLNGKVTHREPSLAVIDINGVGYEIKISLQTYSVIQEGQQSKLFTYLSVTQDSQELFGFATESEKKMFLHLISVSGVGRNTALVMLSAMNVSELADAIINQQTAVITKVKGIGKKTAERLILDLKDKLAKEGFQLQDESGMSSALKEQASNALVSLGLSKLVADRTINAILKKYGTDISLEELITYSLQEG
ncbi:Holliday junction branch migration protein RuvA [Bernardetia sp.]|uniref:Holliday junction branch migration protein RuvA n=1 Tax=Bernardetia sp. TaxID=1937974 RepID=UPI0025BAD3C2|nr:Holliday junction branch migration protein RuvA [Bernardetia sp.]